MGRRKNAPNEQELRFLEEYWKDLHQTNAAIRAGISVGNAAVWACETLKKTYIKELIAQRRADNSSRTNVEVDKIVERLKIHALTDRISMVDEDGYLLPVDQWPDAARALVVGIETTDVYDKRGDRIGKVTKVKLTDPTAYLKMLMQYTGQFKKDNDQKRPKLKIGYGGSTNG